MKITPPKISVVIPVFNAGDLLTECLTRLHRSDYANFEVIVVDDGSTDNSGEIARSFTCQVMKTPGRGGPAAARNLGARHAIGEILFFLDSDVMVQPHTLSVI